MNKALTLLLVSSLLANAAFTVLFFRPGSSSSSSSNRDGAGGKYASAGTLAPADSAIIAAIGAGDPNELIARLNALGVPTDKTHIIATGLEMQKIADELAELRGQIPYWRSQKSLPLETRKKISLLGSNFRNRFAHLMPQLNKDQYEFLSPERRAELQRLERDYDDLTDELKSSAYGFMLKSNYDDLNLLIKERKREIDEFFTPEERVISDLRHSPVAKLLQNEYGNIIETEDEYKSIYAIMEQAANDDAGRRRIEELLGPERMEKLMQLNDPDAPLILSASERLNLPLQETTTALAGIRADARQSAAAIMNDRALTASQKRTALRGIAAGSQERMTSVLGQEGARAFANRSEWMGMLRRGSSFTVRSNGTIHSVYNDSR